MGEDAGEEPLASLQGVMQREMGMAVRMVGLPDFAEGVRAVLVDKDRRPNWRPALLSEASQESLQALLEPLPEKERLSPDYFLREAF